MEPSARQFGRVAPSGGDSSPAGLARYLATLRAHLRLIILCVIVTFAASVAYVKLAPKSYTATAQLLVQPLPAQDSVLETVPGNLLLHASGDPTTDVLTAASVVHTQQIAQATAAALGPGHSAAQILQAVSVVPTDQSNLLSVSASSSDPRQAQRLVNTYAREVVAVRTAQLHAYIARVLPGLKASLARSPGSTTTGGSLADLVGQLSSLQSGADPSVAVSSPATLPTAPTSPKTSLSLIAGILIGLLVGCALAFGIDALDPPVRNEAELRERFGAAPVLARIPQRTGPPRPGPLTPMDLSAVALEQYRTLRATIPMRSQPGKAHSFLLCSAAQAEGKSTSAISLAAVLAQSGVDVLLIDADLRRPSIGHALGLSGRPGVEAVLRQEVELSEAVQGVRLGNAATLNVLPAQGNSIEVADQLSPAAAMRLVQAAERRAEVIIIDSPPLTAVGDALPFARLVDDVLLVVRLGETKLSKLSESWELLGHQHSQPSGIVIVGTRAPSGPAYGYSLETAPTDWRATAAPPAGRVTARTSKSRSQ
ncbi:MAG TPA: Wzz/FepE/Etk N-terminal domain-containing protein [Solirubrobacteraceae bacterium]|nr:Wzz/FepE/Etk N-terminal domain-containing protein [Solirubrobacteraceae bacterium]